MSGHTPGPWRIDRDDDACGIVGRPTWPCKRFGSVGEWDVASIDTGGEDDEANARLISAAPELLEACVEFVRKVDAGEARSTKSYAQMKAAIAKAKGEQPWAR